MTKDAIRAAVSEARRFIQKAEAVQFHSRSSYTNQKNQEVATEGKASAAMRRASLDLSMALAVMRKTPRA